MNGKHGIKIDHIDPRRGRVTAYCCCGVELSSVSREMVREKFYIHLHDESYMTVGLKRLEKAE